jgi:tripartite-type tricarboxylate transporter receptor subunit TctC
MFRIITALMLMTSVAVADYNLIVPQKPSGGTSVWAQIVVKNGKRHLGEKINLVYKPGARDQLGPNEFQNTLRFDNKTILVSHGGNGISYLIEPVDYNYLDWENIGQMNLNIIVGARKTPTQKKVQSGSQQGQV